MTMTEHQAREHTVNCDRCQAPTWNHDAICDACHAREADAEHRSAIAICEHEHTDYQGAEPDVGIRYESLICEDCGEDLADTLAEMRDEALIRKGEIAREEGWR